MTTSPGRDRSVGRALLVVSAVYFLVTLSSLAYGRSTGQDAWPLKHDQVGYYAWLPALLTEGGVSFDGSVGERWDAFMRGGFTGFQRHEATGRRVNIFGPGVAFLVAPFFAVGHLVALATGADTDGFSPPYLVLSSLAAAVYAILGLALLAAALRPHFDEGVTAGVVVALGLGTNLLYYGTIEPLMTHAFSFFAFAAVVWATLRWMRHGGARGAAVLGAAVGLAFLIRPTNGVIVLLPVGMLVGGAGTGELSWRSAPERSRLVRQIAIACAVALAVGLPLFAYSLFATGSLVPNPHGAGAFYWTEPRIGGVLWSYRKGWWVYTPMMLMAVPGLFLLHRCVRGVALPLTLVALAHIYVVSSYWSWWYGGSFGMRALIETSAGLALALAAFLAWMRAVPHGRRLTTSLLAVFIALNVFQTYQYVMTYIHWDGMTKETYWAVFGRPSIPADELESIRSELDLGPARRPRPD